VNDQITRRYQHRDKVLMMDRTDWTRADWVADAFEIMADEDGSAISMMNGHVKALLAEVEDLRTQLSSRN